MAVTDLVKGNTMSRIIFENRFGIEVNFDRPTEVEINAPIICPFCGSTSIFGQMKVKDTAEATKPHKFINVRVCPEHEKFKPLEGKSMLIPCAMMFAGILFSILINWILAMAFPVLGMVYFNYLIVNDARHADQTKKVISFEFFSPQSVIHAARKDWADNFTILNRVTARTDKVHPFELRDLPLRFFKPYLILLVIFSATLVLVIISSAVRNRVLGSIFAGAMGTSLILFLITLAYFSTVMLPRKKKEWYFPKPSLEKTEIVFTGSPNIVKSATGEGSPNASVQNVSQCVTCHSSISLEQYNQHYKRCLACYLVFKKQVARKLIINGVFTICAFGILQGLGLIQLLPQDYSVLFDLLMYFLLGAGVLDIGYGLYWLLGNPSKVRLGLPRENRV